MKIFRWPVRVYYEDTDSGGVVYYANYLKFMERARTEWLRSLGVEQDQLVIDEGLLFAVHSVEVNYRVPARFNDQLIVVSAIENLRPVAVTFRQRIFAASADENRDRPLCEGRVQVACVDQATFRPKPIPLRIITELQGEY